MTLMGARVESFADETRSVLQDHGYAEEDVLWVGIPSKEEWDVADFMNVADRIYYDSGFGAQEIEPSLVICMRDGSWFERAEYDGSEWWDHKMRPMRPARKNLARKDRIHIDTW